MSNSKTGIQLEIIHTYSRKQSLEDGTLIVIAEHARLYGFKIPTAITSSLWVYIGVSPELAEIGQVSGWSAKRYAFPASHGNKESTC
ncbi:MAG: hypothetical protein IKN64_05840 [Desulfovibrio sp.]|nr:hypothetical protein [Desulfovibrio sp.]